jgi:putative OPT family oligopeptide transporter
MQINFQQGSDAQKGGFNPGNSEQAAMRKVSVMSNIDDQDAVSSLEPTMSPLKEYREINFYVVFWGLFYAALFALAVGYLGLKIGQTVDAFAPVSVLAMGMAAVLNRKNAFPENIHIQAIASAGTNILGGTLFIIPAFFILKVSSLSFFQLAVPIVLGGLLGVLLAALFRRYFCEEMHHAYPFPAGRAAAGVLTCNEGGKVKLMVASGMIALVFDFIINSLGWWQEVLSTTAFRWGQVLADKYKLVFSLDNDAALLGLGYFTGLRYAAIIAAGSFFAWYVCIPVVYYIGGNLPMVVDGKHILLANASVQTVFTAYVRHIGIGALATAGIIGLLTLSNVVKSALTDIFKTKTHRNEHQTLLRTQQDLSTPFLLCGILAITLLFTLFFYLNFSPNLLQTFLAFIIVLVFNFALSVVGISSIAFTGIDPVSGMTIFMIIVAAVVLDSTGLTGTTGTIAVLMMAAFLCTTLGVAGNFMSELKVAHLLGATPRKMQRWQLVSVALSAVVSVGVIITLNKAYGFIGQGALPAPQANAMAAIAQPLMEGVPAHWPLYMAGAFLAVILWMMKIPPLPFALGAYLPMELNTPILIGGLIAHFVANSSKDKYMNELRLSEGSTIASGLIAGGALGSLVSAVLHILGFHYFLNQWVETPAATYLGIFAYALLGLFLYKRAIAVKTSFSRKTNSL